MDWTIKRSLGKGILGIAVAMLVLTSSSWGGDGAQEAAPVETTQEAQSKPGFWDKVGWAWGSLWSKLESYRKADIRADRLTVENESLRAELESQKWGCRSDSYGSRIRELGEKIKAQSGKSTARGVATVDFQVPENLVPEQLFTYGLAYFYGQEYEKAAVVFDRMTQEPSSLEQTMRVRAQLLAAVSFFKLDDYHRADGFFSKILEQESSEGIDKYRAQAMLWRAVIARKENKKIKEKLLVNELVDRYPHSREASWVNRKEGERRTPASTKKNE